MSEARTLRLARGAVALAIGLSLALGIALGQGPLAPARTTGWAALVALVLALACSPVAAIAARLLPGRAPRPSAIVSRARRGIGVSAFALAAAHALLATTTHLGPDLGLVLEVDRLRHGALALLLLAPLAATSSTRVARALGLRAWKALHRAAYLASILAFAHAIRGPHAPTAAVLGGALVLGALLVARPLIVLVLGRSAPPPAT